MILHYGVRNSPTFPSADGGFILVERMIPHHGDEFPGVTSRLVPAAYAFSWGEATFWAAAAPAARPVV